MEHVTGSARSEDVRTHNLASVLSHLDLWARASRSELAVATGLVPGAVTSLVQELLDDRLVEVVPQQPREGRPRRGRPAEDLRLDGSDLGFVVVRFLRDEVTVVVCDLAGRVRSRTSRPVTMPVGDPDGVAAVLAEHARPALEDLVGDSSVVVSLTLVVPAPVDPDTGRIPWSIDLDWEDVDLAALVAERLTVAVPDVRVLNDAQTATHAEAQAASRSTGTPVQDLVYVKADTGIGGGAVVGGRLLRGPGAFVFQPGHVVVDPHGAPCSCGKQGCLVTVAGPDVLLRAAGLTDLAATAGEPAAFDELFRRLAAEEPVVVAAVAEAAGWVRLALVNVCVLLAPRVVVLGGHLARLRDVVLAGAAGDGLEQQGRLPHDPVLVAARHGDDSAVQGALSIARSAVLIDPSVARRLRAADLPPSHREAREA